MASLAPIPGVGLYAATKIFTDFLTQGLIYELAKYEVDVTGWRAAGVASNIFSVEVKPSLVIATPEQYVNAAFSKMTSGLHSGYFAHEMIHLVWTNLLDILPISACQNFWRILFTKHFAEMDE